MEPRKSSAMEWSQTLPSELPWAGWWLEGEPQAIHWGCSQPETWADTWRIRNSYWQAQVFFWGGGYRLLGGRWVLASFIQGYPSFCLVYGNLISFQKGSGMYVDKRQKCIVCLVWSVRVMRKGRKSDNCESSDYYHKGQKRRYIGCVIFLAL